MDVLQNRWTASAGESAVAYCKSVPDAVCIGENPRGMGMFESLRLVGWHCLKP